MEVHTLPESGAFPCLIEQRERPNLRLCNGKQKVTNSKHGDRFPGKEKTKFSPDGIDKLQVKTNAVLNLTFDLNENHSWN